MSIDYIEAKTIDQLWQLAEKVAAERPLIHSITNEITVNDCANVILACGASPVMAHWSEEVAEVTATSKALCCNLGATEYLGPMAKSAETAHSLSIPWLLDPVGVAVSTPRRKVALDLIEAFKPTVIRGNLTEIKALIKDAGSASGVDALEADFNLDQGSILPAVELLSAFARERKAIVAASGATDIITDGRKVYLVENGSSMMRRVTGTGCMSSVLMASFLAAEDSIEAVTAAALLVGIAGSQSETMTLKENKGTGTFRTYLIDRISLIDKETINLLHKVKQVTL